MMEMPKKRGEGGRHWRGWRCAITAERISAREVSFERGRTRLSNAPNRVRFHPSDAEISPNQLSKPEPTYLPNCSTKSHVYGVVRTRIMRRIDWWSNQVFLMSGCQDKG